MGSNSTSKDVISPQEAHTLAGLFKCRVTRSPDIVAYRRFNAGLQQWQDLTWAAMEREVIRWQQALQQDGLQPGDRVAVMLRNSPEWVMFDQAALGLGLVVVPLYTEDRAENVAYILQNANVRLLLIGGDEHWQQLQTVRDELDGLQRILAVDPVVSDVQDARLLNLADWLPAGADAAGMILHPSNPDDLATIVYTSGTTGRSKGVMLSHRNILWNAYASQQMADIYPDDLFLSFLPLSHTLERTVGYYLSMMCGATVAYNRSIPELAEDLITLRPTVLISVPRIFERVYNRIQEQLQNKSPLAWRLFLTTVDIGWQRFEYRQGRRSWSPALIAWPVLNRLVAHKVMEKLGGRMRLAVCGGAALPLPVARLFIGLGLNILQGYGLTETSPVLTVNTVADNIPDSIGVALPDVELRQGEHDELLARSPGVMLGYWGNAEATRAMIDAEGWLHTGDKARIANDGHVFITGRLKDIIVLANGEKVSPADMEMTIASDPLFEQVMVIGDDRPFLAALLVVNPEQARQTLRKAGLDPAHAHALQHDDFKAVVLERIAGLIRTFPGYAQIRNVCCFWEPWSIDDDLLTPTLKVRRQRVEHRFQEEIERLYEGH